MDIFSFFHFKFYGNQPSKYEKSKFEKEWANIKNISTILYFEELGLHT